MFFGSKRKPTDEDAKRLLAPPPVIRPVVRSPIVDRLEIQDSVMGADQVLTDVKSVPTGTYFDFEAHGLPKSFESSFALLSNPTAVERLVLLVAPDSFATNPMLELMRRLRIKRDGGTQYNVNIKQASREVIKYIHGLERANQSADKGTSSSVEVLAWELIEQAIEKNTSDIHIETRGSYAQVLFRIFGRREEQANISFESATSICNVLYGFHADSSSKELSWSHDAVKDTSFEYTTKSGKSVQCRFSSGPIHPGKGENFHAVIRLLVMEASAVPLEKVGYTGQQVAAIEQMLIGAQGMVLLTGPTNSGKSTSMQAMISRIYERRGKTTKVITVEKPVEYLLPLACQMGVPEGRKSLQDKGDGNIYTSFLKGTLRQDPDVVMVGEIRASDEAEATKDLVLAGRKLITTLHVYEVMAVFARLAELGIPKSILLMDGFISGVLYQRLVPVLCKECSLPLDDAHHKGHVLPDVYERVLRVTDSSVHDVRVRHGQGCQHCDFRGVVGRTLCAELLVPDSTFLQHLRDGNEAAARAHWQSKEHQNIDGIGVTAVAHAISKMRLGLLDPHDIETQIGKIMADRAEMPRVDVQAPGYAASYGNATPKPSALRSLYMS